MLVGPWVWSSAITYRLCRLWLTSFVSFGLQACQQSLTGGVGAGLRGRAQSKLYGPTALSAPLAALPLNRTGFWLRLAGGLYGACWPIQRGRLA